MSMLFILKMVTYRRSYFGYGMAGNWWYVRDMLCRLLVHKVAILFPIIQLLYSSIGVDSNSI